MSNKIRLGKKKLPASLSGHKPRPASGQNTALAGLIQTGLYSHQNGNFQQAEGLYRQVLAVEPTHPEANYLLGLLSYQCGHLATALSLVEKVVQTAPAHADAHNLLGSIHHAGGQYQQAIACYRRALQCRPDLAMAHNNLGIVLEASGQYQEALVCYQKALAIHPGYAEAHANRAIVYRVIGQVDEAVISYGRALLLRPNFPEAWSNFAELLKLRKILPEAVGSAQERKSLLINGLRRGDVETQNFAAACLHELLLGTIRTEVSAFIAAEDHIESYQFFYGNPALRQLFAEPLFLLALKKTVLADPGAEKFLTRLRKGFALLLAGNDLDDPSCQQMLPLLCALAQQCFWNEYVYQVTADEAAYLAGITKQLLAAGGLATARAKIALALLACYTPLDRLDIGQLLPENPVLLGEELAEMVRSQIVEGNQERELRTRIKSLGTLQDEVSQLVRQQYEENPYPRWTGMAMIPPRPFIEFLRQDIAPNLPPDLCPIERPEVLIAGCGTGRQPIASASCYLNSSVLALDLSLASLAYARRKAEELGITNIEFLQGDILSLPELDKTFDVIECCGVLHHMGDPARGLGILVDRLTPRGYLKLGLYSELARRHIVAAREFIKDQGFTPTSEGIRECRQAILALPDDHLAKRVCNSQDFYATSTVRDLIFHVQEHRFTLPEIARLLAKFNLEFLGLASDLEVKNGCREELALGPQGISLDAWDQYEQQHPWTFFEMYNFWVRKRQP